MQYRRFDVTITVEAEERAWGGADLLCPACVEAHRERRGDTDGGCQHDARNRATLRPAEHAR